MSPCGHFFRSRDPRPAGSGGAEGEHPLDVPCHGHEAPLATHLVEPAQQELAESEDRFDDAEHWFRDLFTQRIELPAFWRFQPMRHGLDRPNRTFILKLRLINWGRNRRLQEI